MDYTINITLSFSELLALDMVDDTVTGGGSHE